MLTPYQNPAQYIEAVLRKVKKIYLERTYGMKGWKNGEEFLEMLARKGGRLLKAGEADKDAVAKMVIADMCRGEKRHFLFGFCLLASL